jgi:hypothetical protein
MKRAEPRLTAPMATAELGKAADHHGVHDGHAHPAEFGGEREESEAERVGRIFCGVGLEATWHLVEKVLRATAQRSKFERR